MRWRNTQEKYGYMTVALHWTTALLIYGMFGLGLWMVTLGYYDSWYHTAPELHKSIGVILFFIMLARVIWRSLSPSTPLETHSRMTQIVAIAAHHLMYMLIFAVMISGYLIATADGKPISVFGWFTLPALLSGEGEQADIAGRVHLWLAWGLIGLSALHALAALKHHFIDKDATLSRMLSKS